MAFEHKPNRGSLFKNADKQSDTDRDYSGTALIDGPPGEYWVSGWVQETSSGKKYLSLSFKPKNANTAQPKKSVSDDLNDAVPF